LDRSQIEQLAKRPAIAHLIVPIFQEQQLWGLARPWQDWEIKLLKKLATQVAISTDRADRVRQSQTESIAREQTEASLKREHEFVSAVLDTLERDRVVIAEL